MEDLNFDEWLQIRGALEFRIESLKLRIESMVNNNRVEHCGYLEEKLKQCESAMEKINNI